MPELLVFAVALAARLATAIGRGGFTTGFGYDPGVYYAAADALTFGRLPYRDFVLLHPPGIMLALTPFAALGRLTTDHTGFVAGDIGFMLLGCLNAVLVVRVARGMGLPRSSAVVGGLFYAVWLGSTEAEYVGRLEPLGDFLVLCGLLALTRAARMPSRRRYLLAGAAFGAAAGVKIWWVVPLLIVLGWLAFRSRRAGLLPAAAGAAGALLAIDGPFFLAAPTTMWHMVVTAQLGRPVHNGGVLLRLTELIGLDQLTWPTTAVGTGGVPSTGAQVTAVVLLCGFAVALALAWRVRPARLVVVLVLAQTVVLLAAPSWFGFYADFVAPAAALTLAAASAPLRTRIRTGVLARAVPWLAVGVAAAITIGALVGDRTGTPLPTTRLTAAEQGYRCVMSNAATGLIVTDMLSHDLSAGCPEWIDVSGRAFGVAPGPHSGAGAHLGWAAWQALLRSYLFSGQAVLTIPHTGAQPDHFTLNLLRRYGAVVSVGGAAVYGLVGGPPAPPAPAHRLTRHGP